jgi:hypothetical protein
MPALLSPLLERWVHEHAGSIDDVGFVLRGDGWWLDN